jgi:cation transport ATPase
MRRGCSVTLLILGGWLLSSVGIIGLMPEEGISRWIVLAVCAAFALPFVLVGAWVSPGRRLAELGLTLMVAGGCAAVTVMTMAIFVSDPAMPRFMPRPFPDLDFTSPPMIVSILLMGGGGYALWRLGRRERPSGGDMA